MKHPGQTAHTLWDVDDGGLKQKVCLSVVGFCLGASEGREKKKSTEFKSRRSVSQKKRKDRNHQPALATRGWKT